MKSYFKFSKSQKIGVVAIIIVIFIQLVVLNKGNTVGVPNPFAVNKSDYLIEEASSYYSNDKSNNVNSSYVLDDFDPNVNSIDDWVKFGFSKKQAQSIISYKTKINGFKQKEDLKKVFVISTQKYKELEPYIKIPTANNSKNKNNSSSSEADPDNTSVNRVDINTATIEQLIAVKGIGEYTANGILKYKEFLGGFHSKSQLKEVYGISDDNFLIIKSQIQMDSNQITKLNVNELSLPDLKKHPYITWTIANAIIDKRLVNKLASLEFLRIQQYLTQDEYNNLLPYIKYD
jgi:competence protein ComEA